MENRSPAVGWGSTPSPTCDKITEINHINRTEIRRIPESWLSRLNAGLRAGSPVLGTIRIFAKLAFAAQGWLWALLMRRAAPLNPAKVTVNDARVASGRRATGSLYLCSGNDVRGRT